MALKHKAPRGTHDILPGQSHIWQWMEAEFQATAELYGYREIRTPMFEDTELFLRTSGDTSEVSKQMYTFDDKGGRSLTLRPEGTAPAMRACLEHGLLQPGTALRLWYMVPFFRYERPQKGRFRQPHQLGLELIGTPSPLADAEIIEATVGFFQRLGLREVVVKLNSIGREATREKFKEAVLEHISGWLADQDEEGKAKAMKNPLRLFDSKAEDVQTLMADAPLVSSFLEDASRLHFEQVQAALAEAGTTVELDPRIVRGLDYYTDTVFEIQSNALGSQSSLCGGGRYDGLIEELGGPSTPSVGVGIGMERLEIVLEASGLLPAEPKLGVFLVGAGEAGLSQLPGLARELRASGISSQFDLDGRGLKQQFKQANKSGARVAVILGDDEIAAGAATIKDLETTNQTSISRSELTARLKATLGL